jgi:hypothetical protein
MKPAKGNSSPTGGADAGRQLVLGPRWWLGRLWAAPYTLLGASIGGLGLLTGGRLQTHSGVIEFHGGAAARFLDLLPLPHVSALTLGHTVIGRDRAALEATRAHERVHVEQFERWGLLMGPAYIGCSVVLWLQGRDFYRDNPFEREAYDRADCTDCTG